MRRSSQSLRPISYTAGLALVLGACAEPLPTETLEEPSFAQAAEPDPVVDWVDPISAPQDTTLDVRVIGANFDNGSTARFKRSGSPPSAIVTNHTTFVSTTELVANITIAIDADVALYDVEVQNRRKRKGVGTELFAVTEKTSNGSEEVALALTDWSGSIWSPAGAAVPGQFSSGGTHLEASTRAKGKGKNATPATELCADLSDLVEVFDPDNYGLFLVRVAADPTSGGLSRVCSEVDIHTRNYSAPEAMRDQVVGTVEYAGGKIVLKDLKTDPKDSDGWEWRVIFDTSQTEPQPQGFGFCFDHPSPTTWHVYNDDDVALDPPSHCNADGVTVDNVVELWRVYLTDTRPPQGVWAHVADFVMPFRFKVTVVQ